jgi:hypothetical protein
VGSVKHSSGLASNGVRPIDHGGQSGDVSDMRAHAEAERVRELERYALLSPRWILCDGAIESHSGRGT